MVSQKGKGPVYEVKSLSGTGRGRILHRNMLLSCDALPLQELENKTILNQLIQNAKRHRNKTKDTSEDSESSSEDEYYWANRLRHHHHKTGAQNVAPQNAPEILQPEPEADVEEVRGDTPAPVLVDNDTTGIDFTRVDTEEVPLTVRAADCTGNQEPELTDMQPHHSQRERRPRETLYDSLGRPKHRVVGLPTNPLYVNALAPGYGQYCMTWPLVWTTYTINDAEPKSRQRQC